VELRKKIKNRIAGAVEGVRFELNYEKKTPKGFCSLTIRTGEKGEEGENTDGGQKRQMMKERESQKDRGSRDSISLIGKAKKN